MIVAFSGKAGVGKTTAAKYLERYYGFVRVSFADKLKRLSKESFPFTDDDLSNPKKKNAPFKDYEWSPREYMVNLGAFCRYHDKDYFVKNALLDLAEVGRMKMPAVIDDLRFPNEAEALKAKKALLIRINRYPKDNPYKPSEDESEIGLDGYQHFDSVIHEFDNKNIRSLTDKLDQLMDNLGLKPED